VGGEGEGGEGEFGQNFELLIFCENFFYFSFFCFSYNRGVVVIFVVMCIVVVK
jgi:hypothetical protein